jgi:hypothetical protein
MRLAELVARYPNTRLATPADNARILDFFERTPMHTSAFDVQYTRRPDFFKLLRYQSDRAFVILTEDEGGNVRSLATASLRPGWVSGQPTTIGYLGDLRVRFDRIFSNAWRRLFADLVAQAQDIEELADCTHWFTTVIDGNRAALAALGNDYRSERSARRARRPHQPSLVPIGPFTMRNLIMRLPLVGRSRSRGPWEVCDARAANGAALIAFFEDENRLVPFGFRGELARRLRRWDGLSIGDFVYAADDRGIAACVAPWSPGAAKQTVVSRVPAMLRLLGRGARALSSPPIRVPEPGEPLRMPYLTHVTFASRLTPEARAGVFRSMLDRLFDRWRGADWHCVAMCDFDAWNLGRALGGFVQQTVPITVYAVVPPGRAQETGTNPSACPPAFEMAMV